MAQVPFDEAQKVIRTPERRLILHAARYSRDDLLLVGSRQDGREYSENLKAVEPDAEKIYLGIQEQLKAGRYPPSNLYGDGNAAPQIAAKVAEVPLVVQKRLDYIYR